MQADYFDLTDEGVRLFEARAYKQALTAFSVAFRLRPESPVSTYNLARTLDELGDPQAENFYYAAVGRGSVDARYQVARICFEAGRKQEGIAHLKEFLKLYTEGEDEFTRYARRTIADNKSLDWHIVPSPQNISVKTDQKQG